MKAFQDFLNQITTISNQEYDLASSSFSVQHVKKGEYFISESKVCRHIAFILSGTLRVYYINNKAEEITSCFCTENHLTTSYKSFILQEPSNLILQAIEDTDLYVIDRDRLYDLYAKSPVWQTIGRVVAEREYLVMEQYASVLNNEAAKAKYLRLLQEQPQVLQIAKIEDVASYLGVTRRTLSRIRQDLAN